MKSETKVTKEIKVSDHEDVSKMNILSAYKLGWITFGEALEKLKNIETDQEAKVLEFKKAE